MHIVIVNINVHPEYVKQFIELTKENVDQSNQEPGVVSFQFLRVVDDPTRFVLYETYKTPDDQLRHRETTHYKAWKTAVQDMMKEPRIGTIYQEVA